MDPIQIQALTAQLLRRACKPTQPIPGQDLGQIIPEQTRQPTCDYDGPNIHFRFQAPLPHQVVSGRGMQRLPGKARDQLSISLVPRLLKVLLPDREKPIEQA